MTSGEDSYNYFWPEKHCISPHDMARLVHSDLYHNYCVFDEEDLPLCSELAAKADDTWCFNLNYMMDCRNKKYEDTIVPSTVAWWELIRYNLPVDLGQFCDTFHCGMVITKECFAYLGLKNHAFEEQYNELFGTGEFAKRRAAKSRASIRVVNS